MYIANTSVVKVAGNAITLVTTVTPPTREKERVDISALADAREQATLGREKQYEFTFMMHWKPGDTEHAALVTKYAAETEFDCIIEFTKAAKKWTIEDCKIQKLGFEQLEANQTLRQEVLILANGAISEASIT